MTYYDIFLDYVKSTVNYKMSTLDPNLIKKFLYSFTSMPSNGNVKINAKEVDD